MNIREKILVIEDEKSIARFISTILTANGYEAMRAASGAEAMSMISSHCPDLVILDLGLPDMDGLDILRQLRSWSTLPVVVVSARSHEQDKVSALDLGADDYLTKPFGTVHALLCAEPEVDGPFCVINADDYYGVDAYRTIYEELVKLPAEGKGTMVGYLLKNTASLHGTVSRGICKVKDGKLDTIQEALKVQLYPDGHLTDLDTDTDLAPDTVVSMNFWGFMPSIFPALRTYFENFLRGLPDDAVKAECLLPLMVGEEVKAGRMTVSVLHSKDRWFGMTYHEDKDAVAAALRALHDAGVYPPTLHG